MHRHGAAAGLDLPPFRPHRLWRTADLQTVRNFVTQPRHDLSAAPAERLWLPVPGGDQLAVALHGRDRLSARPLVLLIHGLTGCEGSHYMQASAAAWLAAGHPVARLNLRGSPPSRPRCGGHYHAGRSQDLAAAIAGLAEALPGLPAAGIVPIGYSLGGNMLIKMLAEAGGRVAEGGVPIRAAGSVSAPIDLKATSRRFHARRNAIYHRWLLARLKRESTTPPAELSPREREAIMAARSVHAFDDGFVGPRHGFTGAEDYYARCSGEAFLPAVRAPLLCVHAVDDPWIPPTAYHRVPWRARPDLGAVLTERGGHVGFHAADSRVAWHNRALQAFVARVAAQ